MVLTLVLSHLPGPRLGALGSQVSAGRGGGQGGLRGAFGVARGQAAGRRAPGARAAEVAGLQGPEQSAGVRPGPVTLRGLGSTHEVRVPPQPRQERPQATVAAPGIVSQQDLRQPGQSLKRVAWQGLQLVVVELDLLQAAEVAEESAGHGAQPVAAQPHVAEPAEAAEQAGGEGGQACGAQGEHLQLAEASEGVLRERAQPRAQRHLQDAQAGEVAEGGCGQGAQLGACQPQLPQAAYLPEEHLGEFLQRVLEQGQEGQIVRMKKEGGGQELEAVSGKGQGAQASQPVEGAGDDGTEVIGVELQLLQGAQAVQQPRPQRDQPVRVEQKLLQLNLDPKQPFGQVPRPIWKSKICVRLVGRPSAAMPATVPREQCAASRKAHLQEGGQGNGCAGARAPRPAERSSACLRRRLRQICGLQAKGQTLGILHDPFTRIILDFKC